MRTILPSQPTLFHSYILLIMNNSNNNNNYSSPSSSSPASSKGKKPLNDITNTVLSSSPSRSSASSPVVGSSQPSASPVVPTGKPTGYIPPGVPRELLSAAPFTLEAYRSEVWLQWRNTLRILEALQPDLSNPSLSPEAHASCRQYHDIVCARERSWFAELSRLTPSVPLPEDPNLMAIHSVFREALAAWTQRKQ